MRNRYPFIFIFAALLFAPSPLFAQESPEALFQKWNEAAKQGNVEEILNLSSARSRQEAEEDMKKGMPREVMVEMLKTMTPENLKIIKTTSSPDGKKASLFVEAMMQDIFTLKGQKPKKQLEKGEVQLVKENGVWKMDKQCWGMEGRCEKEDKGEKIAFGKKVPLKKGASFSVVKGKAANFSSVSLKGSPYVVDLVFQGSDENPMLNYALHASPKFADFYLKVGDQKVTPSSFIEDFEKKEVKVMDPNTTYSRSKTIGEKTIVSILFDIPKDLKGPKALFAKFSVAEQDYWFQVGE